ncbi:MAG: hypothetical protein AAF074_12960 [Pseudomonadota bacterium]
MGWRVHITGASGAGVTTLGRALAQALAVPHHDTDDYYWRPTEPPFTEPRPAPERLRLMEALFLPRRGWVLSGSLSGWGDPVIAHLDATVFVLTPTAERLARLEARERTRYGAQADGPERERRDAFLAWAAAYDDGPPEMRSRARHEAWLASLPCPVLRLAGDQPVEGLLAALLEALPPRQPANPLSALLNKGPL